MVGKWTSADENLCFRFQERETFERPWIIVAFATLLTAGTVIEYFVNGSLHSLTPNIIAFVIFFLWWLTIPMKANETVIEKAVHELMDDIVASDANAIGKDVVKSRVHYDTKGTYAIILGRCFLILLNDGQVWEYPIVYHSSTDDVEGYYECKRNYSVSDNSEHIKAIKPEGLRNLVARFGLSDKAKLWLLIFAIVAIGGLAFGGVYWLAMRLKWWFLLLLVGYGLLYWVTEWLSKRLIYFVFLAVSGYNLIQCDGSLLSESIDTAVLKAFQRISRLLVHDR